MDPFDSLEAMLQTESGAETASTESADRSEVTLVLSLVCPEDAAPGDLLTVSIDGHDDVDIAVPHGVGPGEEFDVEVHPQSSDDEETPGLLSDDLRQEEVVQSCADDGQDRTVSHECTEMDNNPEQNGASAALELRNTVSPRPKENILSAAPDGSTQALIAELAARLGSEISTEMTAEREAAQASARNPAKRRGPAAANDHELDEAAEQSSGNDISGTVNWEREEARDGSARRQKPRNTIKNFIDSPHPGCWSQADARVAATFTRLADPRNYTGRSRWMFDDFGRGRGIAGSREPPTRMDPSLVTRPDLSMIASVNAAAVEHADRLRTSLNDEYQAERVRMKCCKPVTVRTEITMDSDKIGTLMVGDEVVVVERCRAPDGRWRARIDIPFESSGKRLVTLRERGGGWIPLRTKRGKATVKPPRKPKVFTRLTEDLHAGRTYWPSEPSDSDASKRRPAWRSCGLAPPPKPRPKPLTSWPHASPAGPLEARILKLNLAMSKEAERAAAAETSDSLCTAEEEHDTSGEASLASLRSPLRPDSPAEAAEQHMRYGKPALSTASSLNSDQASSDGEKGAALPPPHGAETVVVKTSSSGDNSNTLQDKFRSTSLEVQEMETLLVVCPDGMAKGGDLILVENSAGHDVEINVPRGVVGGDEFEVEVPAGILFDKGSSSIPTRESIDLSQKKARKDGPKVHLHASVDTDTSTCVSQPTVENLPREDSQMEEDKTPHEPEFIFRTATLMASASASLIAAKDAEIERLQRELLVKQRSDASSL